MTTQLFSVPNAIRDREEALKQYREILTLRDLQHPDLPDLLRTIGCGPDAPAEDLKALDEATALQKKIRTPIQIHIDCEKANLFGKDVADEYRRNALMVRELEILRSLHPRVFPADAA